MTPWRVFIIARALSLSRPLSLSLSLALSLTRLRRVRVATLRRRRASLARLAYRAGKRISPVGLRAPAFFVERPRANGRHPRAPPRATDPPHAPLLPRLAIEMGLGKTVVTLAHVTTDLAEHPRDPEARLLRSHPEKHYEGGTLVIVPVSLYAQWCDEVRTKAPGLSMFAYDPAREVEAGESRVTQAELAEFDIVIVKMSEVSARGAGLVCCRDRLATSSPDTVPQHAARVGARAPSAPRNKAANARFRSNDLARAHRSSV